MSNLSDRVPARNRILLAAHDLFYERGIRGVGVNAIIDRAGVAKATLYDQFPSKDDLIVAWLGRDEARWFDRVRAAAEERASTPRETLPAFFDALEAWIGTPDFRGCAFVNSALELGPDHPARSSITAYTREVESYFCDVLTNAGVEDAQLAIGTITVAATRGSAEPARHAAVAIRRLLAEPGHKA